MPAQLDDAPAMCYAAQIRAQIEKDVRELAARLKRHGNAEYWPVHPIEPDYVLIGYLVNTHRGVDLYQPGDLIDGIPVRIDRSLPRTITVCADKVEFKYEQEELDTESDDDGEYVTRTRYDTEDIHESTTW